MAKAERADTCVGACPREASLSVCLCLFPPRAPAWALVAKLVRVRAVLAEPPFAVRAVLAEPPFAVRAALAEPPFAVQAALARQVLQVRPFQVEVQPGVLLAAEPVAAPERSVALGERRERCGPGARRDVAPVLLFLPQDVRPALESRRAQVRLVDWALAPLRVAP